MLGRLVSLLALGLVGFPPGSPERPPVTIVAFGDSLTAGYGLTPEEAWPAVLEQLLRQEGRPAKVRNAGLSGETTAGGVRRIEWVLRECPDFLILALGANDGLRGLPLQNTEENLLEIIRKARSRCPNVTVVLAGMLVPPNLGPEYARKFRDLFPRVAREGNAVLIPFLLEGVAGRPDRNLPDGIHPNPEGHRIIARTVWEVLKPLLETPTAEP
ncbi:MAG: arylesterase [Acidobacteriota bacterium]